MSIDAILSPGTIAIGAAVSWLSTAGLVYAAVKADPPIGALTERAVVAFLISTFLTLYVLVAINTHLGFAVIPFEGVVRLLRVAVLSLALVGPAWLVLWWRGRLGDGT